MPETKGRREANRVRTRTKDDGQPDVLEEDTQVTEAAMEETAVQERPERPAPERSAPERSAPERPAPEEEYGGGGAGNHRRPTGDQRGRGGTKPGHQKRQPPRPPTTQG